MRVFAAFLLHKLCLSLQMLQSCIPKSVWKAIKKSEEGRTVLTSGLLKNVKVYWYFLGCSDIKFSIVCLKADCKNEMREKEMPEILGECC